jgi:phytanoyl-CoA hydroxylase
MIVDTAQLRKSFQENGYVIVPNFLDTHELNAVRERLTKLILATHKKQNYEHAFYANKKDKNSLKQLHRIEEDDFFKSYATNSKWSSLASTLLDEPVEPALALEWFNKPPNYFHETPPHQDNFYFCFEPPQALTIWLALDHANHQTGCLHFIPGSHLRGIHSHGLSNNLGFSQTITDFTKEDQQDGVAVTANPGDVVVHHAETIHWAGSNQTTDRNRAALAMVFKSSACQRNKQRFETYQQSAKPFIQQELRLAETVG